MAQWQSGSFVKNRSGVRFSPSAQKIFLAIFYSKAYISPHMERRIDRGKFGRVALGGIAAAIGIATSKEPARKRAQRASLYSLSPEERLFQIKTGLNSLQQGAEATPVVDQPQKHQLVIPGIARGEEIVQPTKKEVRKETKFIARKPEYTYEQMRNLTKTPRGTNEPLRVIETDAPLVALTIDDGFDKQAIKTILAIAQKKGITFTDFMKGQQRKAYPDMVQMLADSEIVEYGNHTETHRDQRNSPVPGVPPTWDVFKEDLYAAEDWLVEKFNQTTKPYVRPPGGAFSEYTTDWNEQMGFLPLNWYANIEDMPLNVPRGAIILAHYRQATVDVFERWVDGMLDRGLYPTAVSNVVAHANNTFLSRLNAA